MHAIENDIFEYLLAIGSPLSFAVAVSEEFPKKVIDRLDGKSEDRKYLLIWVSKSEDVMFSRVIDEERALSIQEPRMKVIVNH